jgi:hypothetical protein
VSIPHRTEELEQGLIRSSSQCPGGLPTEHGIKFDYPHHYPLLFIAWPLVALARCGFNVSIRPYLYSFHQSPKF